MSTVPRPQLSASTSLMILIVDPAQNEPRMSKFLHVRVFKALEDLAVEETLGKLRFQPFTLPVPAIFDQLQYFVVAFVEAVAAE